MTVLEDQYAEAVAVASEALDAPMETFNVRIHVTMRVHRHVQVRAIDRDHCRQLLNKLDIQDADGGEWEFDEYGHIEGDEIAYIEQSDEEIDRGVENEDPDIEVSMKMIGEPYSWDACEIVKKLAQLQPDDHDAIAELIAAAHHTMSEGRMG